MDKIKNWYEKFKAIGIFEKVGLIGVFVCSIIFLISFLISILGLYNNFLKTYSSIAISIALTMVCLLIISIFLFIYGILYNEKNIDLTKQLQRFLFSNILLLIGIYSLLAILALWSANCKKAIEALYKICFICLFISLVLWIIQVICYNYLLKGQVQKVKINLAKINIVRSILVAISGWVLVMVNVGRISKDIHWTYIYAITTTITTLTYPSLDLFEFIYKLIEKLEKSQKQEGKEEKKTNRKIGKESKARRERGEENKSKTEESKRRR